MPDLPEHLALDPESKQYFTLDPMKPVGELGRQERADRIYEFVSLYWQELEAAETQNLPFQHRKLMGVVGAACASLELGYRAIGLPERERPPLSERDGPVLSPFWNMAQKLLRAVIAPENCNPAVPDEGSVCRALLLRSAIHFFTYSHANSQFLSAFDNYRRQQMEILEFTTLLNTATFRNNDEEGRKRIRGARRVIVAQALLNRPEPDGDSSSFLALPSLERHRFPIVNADHAINRYDLSIWQLDASSQYAPSLAAKPDAKAKVHSFGTDLNVGASILLLTLGENLQLTNTSLMVQQLLSEVNSNIKPPESSILQEVNEASRLAKEAVKAHLAAQATHPTDV